MMSPPRCLDPASNQTTISEEPQMGSGRVVDDGSRSFRNNGYQTAMAFLDTDSDTDDEDDDDCNSLDLREFLIGGRTSGVDDNTLTNTILPPTKRRKLGNRSSSILACPFMKHCPERFKSWESCAKSGWPTAHRVKEHMMRRHMLPKRMCMRCGQDFESMDQLFKHQQNETPCPMVPQSHEGINDDQLQMLRSRKKVKGQDVMSEEDKWFKIYRILFPDDDAVPSPYLDAVDVVPEAPSYLAEDKCKASKELGDYAILEGPKLMQPFLNSLLNNFDRDRLDRDRITESVHNLWRQTIQQVIQRYNVKDTPSPGEKGSTTGHPSERNESTPPDLNSALVQSGVGTPSSLRPVTSTIGDVIPSALEDFEFPLDNLGLMQFPVNDMDALQPLWPDISKDRAENGESSESQPSI